MLEQPSILAASSSSVDIESKYPFKIIVLPAIPPPAYIRISIICLVKPGIISDAIEYIVKYAVIPTNVGIVWISITVIRDAFFPLNLYLEYAYPVNETIIITKIAVVILTNKVFPIHFK